MNCSPAKTDVTAEFHIGVALHGARAGGVRVYRCRDCGREWFVKPGDPPPTPWHLMNDEPIDVKVTTPELANVETIDVGAAPNQILIEAIKRLSGDDPPQWLAVIEIGKAGLPRAYWSEGPAICVLAGAQAMAAYANNLLAEELAADDEGPTG